MSTHTVANRVRLLKASFAWVARKGYTSDDLLIYLRPPRTVDQVIEPLNEEEVEKMFSGIKANTVLGARNCALVSLMLDTGLRLSEASYLEESDVHLEERYVKVLGKGGKERIIAFGVGCQRAILHYYHHFRVAPAHTGVSTFFLTIDTAHGSLGRARASSTGGSPKPTGMTSLSSTKAGQPLMKPDAW